MAKSEDQRRADEFCQRLSRGNGGASEHVVNSLVDTKPRREDEKLDQREDDARLVDEAGKVVGPQHGHRAQS